MPATLRPDHDVWIDADRDRFGMLFGIQHHLDVIKIREHKFAAAFEGSKTKPRPEIDEALLCVAVQASVAFDAAQFDTGANELEGEPGAAVFLPDREPFDLCEIRKVTDAQARSRLVADITEQVRRRKVIPIEFFFVGTLLLAQIDGAAYRHDAHDVFKGSGDRY